MSTVKDVPLETDDRREWPGSQSPFVVGPTPAVYGAIAEVQARLARHGISKDKKNTTQGYMFRGIDDIYNALATHLAEVGLCILPVVLSREMTERATQKGGVLFYVLVQMKFTFVSVKDGSSHHVVMYGEAMDSADKATNKAMSAAYKYACLQTFCIPTEGDNDADATTPEVAANITPQQALDLHALAEEVKADIPRMLQFFHAKSVEDIHAADYPRVVKMLESKRAQAN